MTDTAPPPPRAAEDELDLDLLERELQVVAPVRSKTTPGLPAAVPSSAGARPSPGSEAGTAAAGGPGQRPDPARPARGEPVSPRNVKPPPRVRRPSVSGDPEQGNAEPPSPVPASEGGDRGAPAPAAGSRGEWQRLDEMRARGPKPSEERSAPAQAKRAAAEPSVAREGAAGSAFSGRVPLLPARRLPTRELEAPPADDLDEAWLAEPEGPAALRAAAAPERASATGAATAAPSPPLVAARPPGAVPAKVPPAPPPATSERAAPPLPASKEQPVAPAAERPSPPLVASKAPSTAMPMTTAAPAGSASAVTAAPAPTVSARAVTAAPAPTAERSSPLQVRAKPPPVPPAPTTAPDAGPPSIPTLPPAAPRVHAPVLRDDPPVRPRGPGWLDPILEEVSDADALAFDSLDPSLLDLGADLLAAEGAHPQKAASGHGKSLCAFWIGQDSYGLDVDLVNEVLWIDAITTVPWAPPTLLGLFNSRGRVVPVVDLAGLLGVAADRQEAPDLQRNTSAVLLETGAIVVAAVVDRHGLVIQAGTGVFTASESSDDPLVQGHLRVDDMADSVIIVLRTQQLVQRLLDMARFPDLLTCLGSTVTKPR